MKRQKDHEAEPQKNIKPQKSNLNMNEAKFRAGKNFKIRRLIGVLLGMCMLPKRQQIYFTANFWFHKVEQPELCQLVYL